MNWSCWDLSGPIALYCYSVRSYHASFGRNETSVDVNSSNTKTKDYSWHLLTDILTLNSSAWAAWLLKQLLIVLAIVVDEA